MNVFQQLEAERARLEAREAEVSLTSEQAVRALRLLADATPPLQRLGRILAGDRDASNDLGAIAAAMAAASRELRPAVRHVAPPPPRPGPGASVAELARYQAEESARWAQENGDSAP